jgi:hypothetical protein
LLDFKLVSEGFEKVRAVYIAVLILPSIDGCRRMIDSARAAALPRGVGKWSRPNDEP